MALTIISSRRKEAQREIHMRFMTTTALWSGDRFALTKMEVGGGEKWLRCAYLQRNLDGTVSPTVHIGNIFAEEMGVQSEPDAGQQIYFESFEAILDDGWKVD